MLVRGVDAEGNFDRETPPSEDLTEAALAQYTAVMRQQEAILFRNTGRGYK